jgi:hypothetical protein
MSQTINEIKQNKTAYNIISDNNRMKITEYLDQKNIIWGVLKNKYEYVNGAPYCSTFKLSSLKNKHNIKSQDDYINLIKASQKYVKNTSKIAYDTTYINCIDVDTKDLNFDNFKSYIPYVASNNKQLPHFFVKMTNIKQGYENKCRIGLEGVDILLNQGAYSRGDAVVFHQDAEISEVNFKEFLKEFFPKKYKELYRPIKIKKKKEQIIEDVSIPEPKNIKQFKKSDIDVQFILDNLPTECWENYATWFKLSSYIKCRFPDMGYFLWIKFSSKSKKHQSDLNEALFNSIPTKITLNDGVIVNMLKKYNLEAYKELTGDKYQFIDDIDDNYIDDKISVAFSKRELEKIIYNGDIEGKLRQDYEDYQKLNNSDKKQDIVACDQLYNQIYEAQQTALKNSMEYIKKYVAKIIASKPIYITYDYKKNGDIASDYIIHPTKKHFIESWEHYQLRVFKKKGSDKLAEKILITEILKKGKYRIYDKMEYLPAQTIAYDKYKKNTFNLWTGWKWKYKKDFVVNEDLIKNIIYHYKLVFSDDNLIDDKPDALFNYNMKLFKYILLGYKTGIATFCYGAQGAGKNLAFEYFGKSIIGEEYFAYFNSLESLLGRFNNLRAMKTYIICDELDIWAGDNKAHNQLKSLLTSTLTRWEKKCVDAVNIKDYSNYTFLSNFPYGLKTESKGDRRTQSFKCSSKHLRDTDYITKLLLDMGVVPKGHQDDEGNDLQKLTKYEQEKADQIAEHFFHYIMSFNLAGFNPEKIIKTKDRIQGEIYGTPILARFLATLFYKSDEEGHINNLKIPETGYVEISSKDIASMYKKFCLKTGHKLNYRGYSVLKSIYEKYPMILNLRHHTSKGNVLRIYEEHRSHINKYLNSIHTFDKHNIKSDLSDYDFIEDDELGD